jgi:hypothetical protein
MIRPMEATDLTNLEIDTFGKTIRGHVAEIDGRPIAATGVIHTDPNYAFAFMTDEMRKYPREIVRVIRGFSEFLQQYYEVVYAIADIEENNAPAVLRRAGFEYYQTTDQGDVYRWLKPQSH